MKVLKNALFGAMVIVSFSGLTARVAHGAGICGRTAQVREAILREVGGTQACEAITAQDLASVRKLDLYGQNIGAFARGDFDGLSGLEELSLGSNLLTRLEPGLFAGLSSLKNLYLAFNSLRQLEIGLFSGLRSLEFLQLGINELADLKVGVFADLHNLQHLGLAGNKISALELGVFTGLSKLRYLYLDFNRLSRLSKGIFAPLRNLETLSIADNELGSLEPGLFSYLLNLQTLDLHGIGLTELNSEMFAGLSSLRDLRLYSNRLSYLKKGVFARLPKLKSLHLGNNGFTQFEPGTFSAQGELTNLDLELNPLGALNPAWFTGLKSLKWLDVSRAKIRTIGHGTFSGLPNLISLSLWNNQLATLDPTVFSGLKLSHFLLHDNPVDGAPEGCIAYIIVGVEPPNHCPKLKRRPWDEETDSVSVAVNLALFPTQMGPMERAIPILQRQFILSTLSYQGTLFDWANLWIPSTPGGASQLDLVRQLATEVYDRVPSFLPTSYGIHQFPRPEHLHATEELLKSVESGSAEWEKASALAHELRLFFNQAIDYASLRTSIPEGSLRALTDRYFLEAGDGQFENVGRKDFLRVSVALEEALFANRENAEWAKRHALAVMNLKTFALLKFKALFLEALKTLPPDSNLEKEALLNELLQVSSAWKLLSAPERSQLARLQAEKKYDELFKLSLGWQLDRIHAHMNRYIDPRNMYTFSAQWSDLERESYLKMLPKLDYDPARVLGPLLRSSIVTEWEGLAQAFGRN